MIRKVFQKCLSGAEAASSSTLSAQAGSAGSEAGVESSWKCSGHGHLKVEVSSADMNPNLPAFKVFSTKELEI